MPDRTPFTEDTDLTQKELSVVRDLIRQIKLADEIRNSMPVRNLGRTEQANIWRSNVVTTLVRADMPEHLAAFAIDLLTKTLYPLVYAEDVARQRAEEDARFYATEGNFGLF